MELADKKTGLSESEKRVKDKLQDALDISEEFIGKEIEDVNKEIHLKKRFCSILASAVLVLWRIHQLLDLAACYLVRLTGVVAPERECSLLYQSRKPVSANVRISKLLTPSKVIRKLVNRC